MIKRYINLKTTRLKQARKPLFSRKYYPYSLSQKIINPLHTIREKHSSILNSYYINSKKLSNHFKGNNIEDWIAIRILDFLNRARKISDLTEVKEQKGAEGTYSIGSQVAERILKYRNQLAPYRRFTAIAQLEHIDGFGNDKFNDLVLLLGVRADEAFIDAVYDDLLYDNWELKVHRYRIKSVSDFQNIVTSESSLKEFVGEKVKELNLKRYNNRRSSELSKRLISTSYVESFEQQEYAAIAFAFWLYQVDMDNWFSLDKVLQKTRAYFSHYDRSEHRLELRLFKGFPNKDVLIDALTNEDLPVIVNHGEQSISIWTVQLKD